MGQPVSRLAHEVITAFRTSRGRIQISVKDFSLAADGATKFKEGSNVQALSVPGILLLMSDNSFDVVSIVDMPEVLNAIQQASKEILTRFDLKNSKSEIQLNDKDKKIVVTSVDDFKLKAVVDVLQQK